MMTNLTVVLTTLLLKLPAFHLDQETTEERQARMETIATAIVKATDNATCYKKENCKPRWIGSRDQLATLLLTIGFLESGFAKHIHEDKCRTKIGECDGGRAKSLWQVHNSNNLPQGYWATLGGTDLDATTRAASVAALYLVRANNRCQGSILGTISAYAVGSCVGYKHKEKREAFFKRQLEMFYAQKALLIKDKQASL
jgi:hypothetical protein